MNAVRRIAIAAGVVLVLGGCSRRPESSANAERTVVYGRGEESLKLDPADVIDGESIKVIVNIFDTLVTYRTDGAGPVSGADSLKATDLVPGLATEWHAGDEGRTWTFQLRKGVRFHDGTAFNADAVKTSLDRLIDEKHPFHWRGTYPYRASYLMIRSIEVVDPCLVRFHLREPSAVFLANMAMFPASIVSPASLERHRSALDSEGSRPDFYVPKGTGPFRFVRWDRRQRIVIQANEAYWAGPPEIKRVIFVQTSKSEDRLAQLERGEIDMMDGVGFSQVETIQRHPRLEIQIRPGWSLAYLAMNTQEAPFDNVLVRRAVAHAINREKIRKLAYQGYGTIGNSPIPESMWGHDLRVPGYAYHVQKARELLKQAGVSSDQQIRLHAMNNPRRYMPRPDKVAQIIKEDLRRIGLQVEIYSPDWNRYLTETRNGEHQICLLGWSTDNGDPDNFVYNLLDADNARKPSASNVSFWADAEAHRLITEAQRVQDRQRRIELYAQVQRLVHRDVPMVPLIYVPNMVAYSKHVVGYQLHPTGIVWLRHVGWRE